MTLPKIPPRDPQSHKGDFGRVLLIGGSQGMSGAIALAGMAALRSGSGLVRLAVPACVQSEVAAAEPSLMTAALPCDDDGRIIAAAREPIAELAAAADVVALGPGLGRSVALDTLVAWAFTHLERPLLVDADGLNALAEARHLFRPAPAARILTPHPGELERLTGVTPSSGRQDQSAAADQLAAQIAGVVVLKGHGSYVTDGTRQAVNETGNPGLATGGAGERRAEKDHEDLHTNRRCGRDVPTRRRANAQDRPARRGPQQPRS